MAYLLASESGRVAKSDPSPAHLLGAKFLTASALLRGSVQKVRALGFYSTAQKWDLVASAMPHFVPLCRWMQDLSLGTRFRDA